MSSDSTLDHFADRVLALERRLQSSLPGWQAMSAMAPSQRQYVTITEARSAGCREACTSVILYPRNHLTYTVLTLRCDNLQDHGGQVSLAGGAIECGESVRECALREAQEELGIASHDLRTLGMLTPLYIPPSHFCVSPVVFAIDRRPEFRPLDTEVEEVIEIPLRTLVLPSHRHVEQWDFEGEERRVPIYRLEGHKVWGATAMILSELASLWHEATSGLEG